MNRDAMQYANTIEMGEFLLRVGRQMGFVSTSLVRMKS